MSLFYVLLLLIIFIVNIDSIIPHESTSRDNYFWINANLNFWTANRYCQNQYRTDLASIHTVNENEEIIAACSHYANNGSCWIGLTNMFIDTDTYLWMDDTPFNYTANALSGDTGSRCVAVNTGNWVTEPCETSEFTFFCNRPNATRAPTADTTAPSPAPTTQPTEAPTSIPTPPPTQPPQYELNVYYSPNEKYILIQGNDSTVNWWKARDLCDDYFGTNLAIISDESDNMEAIDLCNTINEPQKDCWIGLNRIFGDYEWMDDTSNKGVPNIELNQYGIPPAVSQGYCVYLNNQTWQEGDCSIPQLALCDFPPPTTEPTPMPSHAPTTPTATPTLSPTTNRPTESPTSPPSTNPSQAPTRLPTVSPTPITPSPSMSPTKSPTNIPSKSPTDATKNPTAGPSRFPTPAPTQDPSPAPTSLPTPAPSPPTNAPTGSPTPAPTAVPTSQPTPPTGAPTPAPSPAPTSAPTKHPTTPTQPPTQRPTRVPTFPTKSPTQIPTKSPTSSCDLLEANNIINDDEACETSTIYPGSDSKESYTISVSMVINPSSFRRRRLATTSNTIYGFWTLGGDNDCPNAKIEIKTSAKILNGTREFYVYELDNSALSTTYLGLCQSEVVFGQSCSQQTVCFENTTIYEEGYYYNDDEDYVYGYHYENRYIYAGQTYGIQIVRRFDLSWYGFTSCGSNIDLDLILTCNSNLSDNSGSGSNAAASIVLFVICLLYMIPTFIWACLYFCAKYGTLASYTRRKAAPIIQSILDIWLGSGLMQKAGLIFEVVDLGFDLRSCINIMADAPNKPNSELWRAMGIISIFSFIFSAIFFIFKFNILRRFMPCIKQWKKQKKGYEKEMRKIKNKYKNNPTVEKIKHANKWNEYKKANRKINKYLAHLVMFTLFTASLEDSVQCMVQFRLQWDLLIYSQDGLQLYYNGNGWYWLQVIKGLFGMSYKLSAALVMTFGCHKESLEVDLKPEGVDEDDSDYGPITFQNVFYGKKGLMPGGAVDKETVKETVLTADIVSAAMNMWRGNDNNGQQDGLMSDGGSGTDGGGTGRGDNDLPNGWRPAWTDDGKKYYQNDITKETQWEKPDKKPLESDDDTVPEMEKTIIYLPDPEPDEFTVKYKPSQNIIIQEDTDVDDAKNGADVQGDPDGKEDDVDDEATQILENIVREVSGGDNDDNDDDDNDDKDEKDEKDDQVVDDDADDPDGIDSSGNGGDEANGGGDVDGGGDGVGVDGYQENKDDEQEVDEDDESTEESEDNVDEMEFFSQVEECGDFENAKEQLKDDYDKYEEEWKKNVMEFVQEKAKYLKNLTLKSVAKEYVLSMFNDKNGYKRSMEMLQALNESKDFHKIEKVDDIQRSDNQAP